MVDTPTKVADVIVPEFFVPYVREATTRTNAFFQAGIVQPVGEPLNFGERGGLQVTMPFWKALGERAQLLDDNDDLEIRKIQSGQDMAVQHARALVYGATDLSAALAASDPMVVIGDGIAENWSYELNQMLLATLEGSMGALEAEDPDLNTLDISGMSGAAAQIDGASFIDAGQRLGDQKRNLVAVVMNSAVEAWLAKNDLIDDIRDSDGNWLFNTFQGKRVIVDDSLSALSPGIYTTYLFAAGAIGFAEGSPKVPTETDRDPLINGGQEYLVSRRHFVLHPRGIAWSPQSGVPVKQTPSDAELADPDNWIRAYESKNIRIVRFVHLIG